MPETSAGAFGPIIGAFPVWVAEELAQAGELRLIQAAQQALEWEPSRVGGVVAPGSVACPGVCWRTPLPQLITPQRVPTRKEPAHHRHGRADGAGEECAQVLLLRDGAMVGSPQQIKALGMQ